MKMIPQQQSRATTIVAVLAIVLVVIRHGQNLHRFYPDGNPCMPAEDYNIFIQRAITDFTALAVPLFFLISGALFFHGAETGADVFQKIKRRFFTLLLPYCLWNVSAMLLGFLLAENPVLHEDMINSMGLRRDWWFVLSKLTWDPIIGQFWYIRTLLIFCFLSPLFLMIYAHKVFSLLLLLPIAYAWNPIDTAVFSTEGLVFFYTGGLIGYHRWYEGCGLSSWRWILWLVVIVWPALKIPIPQLGCLWQLQIVLSVAAVWQLALLLERTHAAKIFLALSGYSFFLYALHGDCLGGLSLLSGRFLPHAPWISLLTYAFNIAVVTVLAVVTAKVWKRLLPKVYYWFTGGR